MTFLRISSRICSSRLWRPRWTITWVTPNIVLKEINGYSSKTVKTRMGEAEIAAPRDRNAEFEPQIIPKYERNASQIENQIVAMYAKGLSTRDIKDHLKDIYGIDVSAGLVSKVTDRILPLIVEWQCRPLDRVYPIVFLDAIYFKIKREKPRSTIFSHSS